MKKQAQYEGQVQQPGGTTSGPNATNYGGHGDLAGGFKPNTAAVSVRDRLRGAGLKFLTNLHFLVEKARLTNKWGSAVPYWDKNKDAIIKELYVVNSKGISPTSIFATASEKAEVESMIDEVAAKSAALAKSASANYSPEQIAKAAAKLAYDMVMSKFATSEKKNDISKIASEFEKKYIK